MGVLCELSFALCIRTLEVLGVWWRVCFFGLSTYLRRISGVSGDYSFAVVFNPPCTALKMHHGLSRVSCHFFWQCHFDVHGISTTLAFLQLLQGATGTQHPYCYYYTATNTTIPLLTPNSSTATNNTTILLLTPNYTATNTPILLLTPNYAASNTQ